MSAIIRVALSRTELEIEPGQKGQLDLTIQNLSEIVDQYLVTIEGFESGWVTASPERMSLFPQDQGPVVIELHPPEVARAGSYDFAVKVTSRENPIEWSRATATLEVTPVSVFEIELSPQRKVLEGAETTFQVGIKNPGNVDLSLRLSASDPEEACDYHFDPAAVTVEAGSRRSVALTVVPREPSAEEQKVYGFVVKAAPANAPEKARSVSGQLAVLPRVLSLEVGLWPETRSAIASGAYQIQLANRGNTKLTVDLEGTDPGEACAYKFEPAQVLLGAGESRRVGLIVAPYGKLPTEEPRVYDFSVRAVPREAPHTAKTVSGRFECRPKVISFDMWLSPEKQSTQGHGTFTVHMENRAETPVILDLSAADAAGQSELALGSQRVDLEPREADAVTLQVIPKQKPPRGETTRIDFQVEAVPDEAQHLARSLSGTLEVTRKKARWGWAVAAVLLMMLVGCILAGLAYGDRWIELDDLWGRFRPPSAVPDPDRRPGARFWADPDVIPRGECTLLKWRASRPEAVVVEGPGVYLEAPFHGEVGANPGVRDWDVRRAGEDLEGELVVCPEESAEFVLVVIREDGERAIPTFVRVEE